MASSSFHRTVNALGAVSLVAYLAMATLSYFQTPALWTPSYFPRAAAFFEWLHGVERTAAIRAFFGGPFGVLLSHFIPLVIASAVSLILIVMLTRNEPRRPDKAARQVLRWAFAFAFVGVFSYPVFTQDFWLSAVWGDMVASGLNPYYVTFTPRLIDGLPLDHFPMTMSYGPAWALISGAVMMLSGGSILAAGLLFKLVLAGAWCASLILIDKIMLRAAPSRRAAALVFAGWAPLGVWQIVGEGHNDIIMVFPALLWVLLLIQKSASAPLALAASVLCKYTTAPLFLVDFLHSIRVNRVSLRDYALRLGVAVLAAALVTAIFYRSFAFFDGVKLVSTWHFMEPGNAFDAVNEAAGGWLWPVRYLVGAIFPVIAIHQGLAYWRGQDTESLLRFALALMCAVSFSAISHIWPWYIVWTLAFAALVPGWWLSRFILGLSILAPFTAVVWWVPEAEGAKDVAALAMYSLAILWAVISGPRPARKTQALPEIIRQFEFPWANGKPVPQVLSSHFESDSRPEAQLPVKAASAQGSSGLVA